MSQQIGTIVIALCIMVKNEQKRIHVSLESALPFVNICVIYDTGSTDKTIDIIKDYCDRYDKPIKIKHGKFIDFSTSRNVLLDFVDNKADWALLLD